MDAATAMDLPPLPSDTAIVTPTYMNLCKQILGIIVTNGLHRLPKRVQQVVDFLWTNAGVGPCDGVYAPWSENRASRNMKRRVEAILAAYNKENGSRDTERVRSLACRIVGEADGKGRAEYCSTLVSYRWYRIARY